MGGHDRLAVPAQAANETEGWPLRRTPGRCRKHSTIAGRSGGRTIG
jgi:hypothetical protein